MIWDVIEPVGKTEALKTTIDHNRFFDTPKAVSGFIPVFDVTYRHIQLAKTRMTNETGLSWTLLLCVHKSILSVAISCWHFEHHALTHLGKRRWTSMKAGQSLEVHTSTGAFQVLPVEGKTGKDFFPGPSTQLVYPFTQNWLHLARQKKSSPLRNNIHFLLLRGHQVVTSSSKTFQGTVKEDKATGRMML